MDTQLGEAFTTRKETGMFEKTAPIARENGTHAVHRRAVEKVIFTMRDDLEAPLCLEQMAKIAYMSAFHFNRVFRQITGIPPLQFLYALRIQHSKSLMLTTQKSVAEVCYEVGYNSLGTFTSRFTKLVGLSPCHFRRMADYCDTLPLDMLAEGKLQERVGMGFVCGRIDVSAVGPNAVFIGLFPEHIPQGHPIAGSLLIHSGPYCIGPVPDGVYYLFAAAFPASKNTLTYLLPDAASLLVGVTNGPIRITNGQASGSTEITLRPMRSTDPPILVALPFLLMDRLRNSA